MNRKKNRLSDNDFVYYALKYPSNRELSSRIGYSEAGVCNRLRKLISSGKLTKYPDGSLVANFKVYEPEYPSETSESGDTGETSNIHKENDVKSDTSAKYRHMKSGSDLGNSDASKIKIDTSDGTEAARFMKDPKDLIRIDDIMLCMKDTDSYEIKALFKQLVVKIFEQSLK